MQISTLQRTFAKASTLRLPLGIYLCALVFALLSSRGWAAQDAQYPHSLSHGFGAAFAEALADPTDSDPSLEPESRRLRQLNPGQLLLEVDPALISHTARWDIEPAHAPYLLQRIVRSIETVTTLRDGRTVNGNGAGFAIGTQLITALHNLEGPEHEEVARHLTMFGGSPASTVAVLPEHDIALLDIPAELCDELCHQPVAFSRLHDIYPDQLISWVHLNDNEPQYMQARIIGFASLSEEASAEKSGQSSCADNLVALIDLPFERGSSGGPVIDKDTGKILGIIQGTLTELSLPSGISSPGVFKPMACIVDFLSQLVD